MTMILKKGFTSFNYRLFVLPAFTRAFLSRVRHMANFPIIQKIPPCKFTRRYRTMKKVHGLYFLSIHLQLLIKF